MKIEVTFGLRLDAAVGQGEDELGKLRVGPAGLLGFLELHTGLFRKAFSHRIDEMRSARGWASLPPGGRSQVPTGGTADPLRHW